jgi:hypothetical protein
MTAGRKKELIQKTTVCIILDKHQIDYLKGVAQQRKISVSQYVREALFPESKEAALK